MGWQEGVGLCVASGSPVLGKGCAQARTALVAAGATVKSYSAWVRRFLNMTTRDGGEYCTIRRVLLNVIADRLAHV
jgi:hypothetical protein